MPRPIDAMLDRVGWKCLACGKPCDPSAPSCGCWVKCECGHHKLRDKECTNGVWHASQLLGAELAELIVEDMAQSYRLFQRGYMVDGLKRAVIRQAHVMLPEVFEGVESVIREKGKPGAASKHKRLR